jgi:hypothetical protein
MRNFAEEVAYLYFRLNGFFLLDNYVTHVGEAEIRMHTDSDLIGIRPSNVCEEVGLLDVTNIDPRLYEVIEGFDFVGLFCEVKGGLNHQWLLNPNRIGPCVKRMGLVDQLEIDMVIDNLHQNSCSIFDAGRRKIIKIVATDHPNDIDINGLWEHFTIQEMLEFIDNRVNAFPVKVRGWNFYSSSVFQYLLYKQRNP